MLITGMPHRYHYNGVNLPTSSNKIPFFHMLTVRETLELAAYLDFPSKSKKELDEFLIDRNLDALGLAKVAHRGIGDRTQVAGAGWSGGERRRLSVGLELI
jgi:ABC-type multidrug transport system ATPase subunit